GEAVKPPANHFAGSAGSAGGAAPLYGSTANEGGQGCDGVAVLSSCRMKLFVVSQVLRHTVWLALSSAATRSSRGILTCTAGLFPRNTRLNDGGHGWLGVAV